MSNVLFLLDSKTNNSIRDNILNKNPKLKIELLMEPLLRTKRYNML